MREIKFRAWVLKDEALDGLMEKTMEYDVESFHDPLYEYKRGNITLMQYTGLKDKDSKEIYEGDIIYFIMPNQNYVEKGNGWEDINTHKGFEVTGEVKFIDGGWFIDKGDESGVSGVPLYFDGEQIVEVKGNIYENPELLER
ncbi:hypothetical protein BCM0060_4739 [Bacillus cereus]|uniref:YopX family protein n=1 Tax=Bacillus cereus TaxID=1396 RepID=UPI001F3A503C|nr:YopX family protein [Bacillus cereus]BCC08476.1 hypothetical protein BCM0060_4739 [Bacillus cereus]